MVSEVRFNFPTFRFPPKSFKVDDALRDYCVIQRPGTTVGSLTVILQYTELRLLCSVSCFVIRDKISDLRFADRRLSSTPAS